MPWIIYFSENGVDSYGVDSYGAIHTLFVKSVLKTRLRKKQQQKSYDSKIVLAKNYSHHIGEKMYVKEKCFQKSKQRHLLAESIIL